MGVWTTFKCGVGHTHRSTQKRHATEAAKECNAKVERLMKQHNLSYDNVCETCVKRLLEEKKLVQTTVCPGCKDAVCKHFFPPGRESCYACRDLDTEKYV